MQKLFTYIIIILFSTLIISCQTRPALVRAPHIPRPATTQQTVTSVPSTTHMGTSTPAAAPKTAQPTKTSPPPKPRPTRTTTLTPAPSIGRTLIDEWSPPPQCKYSIAPDWQHVVAVCPQEEEGEISNIYLAMWGSQAETWQKITEISGSTLEIGVNWAPDSFHFTLGAYGHPLYLYALSTLEAPTQLLSYGLANVNWSPTSQYLAAVGSPLKLHVFDLDGHEMIGDIADRITFQNKSPLQRSLQWLPNGSQLFLFIYDEASQRLTLSLVDLIESRIEPLVRDLPIGLSPLFCPGLSPNYLYLGFSGDEYLNLGTEELRLFSGCYFCEWSQDSGRVYDYQRKDDGQIEVTFYDIKRYETSPFILPEGTYENYPELGVSFAYSEMLGDYFYYQYDATYEFYRYNMNTGEFINVLQTTPNWQRMQIVDRKENRWLVQLWNEDKQWKVLDLKYIITETNDKNLRGVRDN